MNNKINILGSCVTRDIFEIANKINYQVAYYHARSSIISLMSSPCNIPIEEINIQSNFKRRVVNTDLNKNFFVLLEKYKDNKLIIDFIDERNPILKLGSSYITKSKELMESGIIEKFNTELLQEDQVVGIWEEAINRFIQQIKNFYDSKNIILHKVFMAERYRNIRGDFSNFRGHKLEFAEYHNKRLRHYYDYFERNLPDINIIEIPFGTYYADQNHRWGLQPYHYEEDYYIQVSNKLKEIFQIQTPANY